MVAEKGVVTDGYRRVPDQVTEAWSRSAPESGSLLISMVHFPEEPSLSQSAEKEYTQEGTQVPPVKSLY